ncbi:MAG TPA: hypothetical protein VLA61_26645 [Ideonella sp.]|uniref:hypothetical protein n=1 Tax=Ideonella sp. TaxID=1929293 RepID=UPI002CF2CA12|nr:hypothetical protein [Ideonella sp.]HSI51862.1 hypothetical protein [Ideonella sp.]
MSTSQSRAKKHSTDSPAFDRHRNGRRTPAGRQRFASDPSVRPAVASFTRDLRHVRASWTSKYGWLELVVGADPAGLQVQLSTWLHTGTALEECFVIHSLAEFEQWLVNAPTKFDHPVAHDELRRFAHGNLAR